MAAQAVLLGIIVIAFIVGVLGAVSLVFSGTIWAQGLATKPQSKQSDADQSNRASALLWNGFDDSVDDIA